MSEAVDHLLAQILELSARIATADPDARAHLEEEREELRARATQLQAQSRSIEGLRTELEHLERRLEELNRQPIKRTRGKMRERLGARPKAYEEDWVNKQVSAANEDDEAALLARIEQVKSELAEKEPQG